MRINVCVRARRVHTPFPQPGQLDGVGLTCFPVLLAVWAHCFCCLNPPPLLELDPLACWGHCLISCNVINSQFITASRAAASSESRPRTELLQSPAFCSFPSSHCRMAAVSTLEGCFKSLFVVTGPSSSFPLPPIAQKLMYDRNKAGGWKHQSFFILRLIRLSSEQVTSTSAT